MRFAALAAMFAAWSFAAVAQTSEGPAAPQMRWYAGAYSFSDELGGFVIRGVRGTGTRDDPIYLSQEMLSASPVTLVIRSTRLIRPFAFAGDFANGMIHLRIETTNASGLPWIAFGFELQEKLSKPSVYGDGLSFDQRRTYSEAIISDRFTSFSDSFEPYDRLLFTGGHVNHRERATFGFMITDFTPVKEFYLLLDPRIPTS